MANKNKKKNTRRGTKVKVKVKTGSSEKQPSLMRQLLSAGVGGLAGLFANRALGSQGFTGSIDPRIKTLVNDRSQRMETVNNKVSRS